MYSNYDGWRWTRASPIHTRMPPHDPHAPTAQHTQILTWKKSNEAAETKKTHSTRQKKAHDFQSIVYAGSICRCVVLCGGGGAARVGVDRSGRFLISVPLFTRASTSFLRRCQSSFLWLRVCGWRWVSAASEIAGGGPEGTCQTICGARTFNL